jgi:site-specific recombinase XerD
MNNQPEVRRSEFGAIPFHLTTSLMYDKIRLSYMKNKGKEAMNSLIAMNAKDPETMNAIAAELSAFTGIDDPSTWTPGVLLKALRGAREQRQAGVINRKIDIAGIDWQGEIDTFLNYTRSLHTRRAYAAALGKFEEWVKHIGISPLEMSAACADRFIHDLKAQSLAAASVRRDIAAVSAFYTFLERSTNGKVKNPIRGTKQRPPRENKKETIIPDAADYQVIISEMPRIERAIVITMANRGLRIGALPTLELKNGKYHGKSKGKILKENNTAGITLPPEALKAIRAAGLDVKKPFAWRTRQGTANNANALERRINNHMGKLYHAGKINAPYSAHDLRHYFAIDQYKKKKDIYRVSMLLGHANIAITQIYLKSLNVKL